MKITTVGIDLAKNVFSVHGIDAHGKAVLRRTVSRGKVMEIMAGIAPCLVGLEACSGAHHWTRELGRLGHTVHIMAPRFVAPYRKQERQERRQRRRSNLREPEPHPAGVCRRTHRHLQPAARLSANSASSCRKRSPTCAGALCNTYA